MKFFVKYDKNMIRLWCHILKFFILFGQLFFVFGQKDDAKLCPSSASVQQRFSPEMLAKLCARSQKWRNETTNFKPEALDDLYTPAQQTWLQEVQTCNNLICLCLRVQFCKDALQLLLGEANKVNNFTNGLIGNLLNNSKTGLNNLNNLLNSGKNFFNGLGRSKRQLGNINALLDVVKSQTQPALRKEYRMLTDAERQKYHAALNKLKVNKIDGLSKYDLLVIRHDPKYSPGAHFGPALLPFHREMLKQLEIALRLEDPTVAIPYWDSTLDSSLPSPADTVLWTADFLGNGQGKVTSGPFASWKAVSHPKALEFSPDLTIVRNVGQSQFGTLYRDSDVANIMGRTSFNNLTYCIDPFFELVHGGVHMFVGGLMEPIEVSTNDPVFYLLHGYVDYLWEQFRQKSQTADKRETQYPSDAEACNSYHYFNASMQPFTIKNKDGMLNDYTKIYYQYDPTPTCTASYPNCGSPYLFCETKKYKCMSKVRPGGNCAGFEQFDACLDGGKCTQGICGAGSGKTTSSGSTTTLSATTIATTATKPTATTTTTKTTTTTAKTTPMSTTTTTLKPTATTSKATTSTTAPTTLSTTSLSISSSTLPPAMTTSAGERESQVVWIPVTIQVYQNGKLGSIPSAKLQARDIRSNAILPGEIYNYKGEKYPYYEGAAFSQLPNPRLNGDHVEVQLQAAQSDGQPCQATCYNETGSHYRLCDGKLTLDKDPQKSDPVLFTPYKEQVPYLAWNGPFKNPDYVMFVCIPKDSNITIREIFEGATTTQKQSSTTTAAATATTTTTSTFATTSTTTIKSATAGNSTTTTTKTTTTTTTTTTSATSTKTVKSTTAGTTTTARVTISVPNKGTYVYRNECINRHRCCKLWSGVGECNRNKRYMMFACAKACNLCNDSTKLPNGCFDVYAKCGDWKAHGECIRNPAWMEENCPRSCGVCERSENDLRLLCGFAPVGAGCTDHNYGCKKWAQKGECRVNAWWMGENCPLSCSKCSAS